MRKVLFGLLLVSLALNAWLLHRAEMNATRTGAAKALQNSPPPVSVVRASVPSASTWHALSRLAEASPEEWVKQLRAWGADDETTRAILDGVLRGRYRAAVSAWRSERYRTAWWKGSGNRNSGAPSLRVQVTGPEKKLLGLDPLDLADAAVRYDFLSPEKSRLLAMIDLDYAEMQTPGAAILGRASTRAEASEEQLLMRERREDIRAALTPEERAEYDLRFGGTADQNAGRLAKLNVTEAEFRALKPLLDEHREAFGTAVKQSSYGPEALTVEQRTMERVVAALGYDRALEYFWGVSGPYDDVTALLREVHQPATNAARLFQLGAETGGRAEAIHRDASLSVEQKKAALVALQETVRPHLDSLIPAVAQDKLPEAAIGWFRMMSEGRYELLRPTIYGGARVSVPPRSVTAPVTPTMRPVPIVRRPGG